MDNYNNLIKMYLDAKKEHKDAEFVRHENVKVVFIDTTTNRIYDDQLVTNDDTYTILITRRKENDSDQ